MNYEENSKTKKEENMNEKSNRLTRLEKCQLLKSNGYTYNPETGKIFGVKGKEIICKNTDGYISINSRKYQGLLLGHHFAWYMTYGNIDFDELDHINRIKNDNRISNLRNVSHKQNMLNKNVKGYSWDKECNKWVAYICVDRKQIKLGRFNTEDDAKASYLKAKQKYHII